MPTSLFDDRYYQQIAERIASIKDVHELYDCLVNIPFEDKSRATMLGMGHMMLVLVNKKNKTIDRIALSKTDSAQGAVDFSILPFKAIKIPLSNKENYLGIAIRTNKPMSTTDWYDTFTPVLTAEQARMNQAGGGIGSSFVYPLPGVGDGAAFGFSFYEPISRIDQLQHEFMKRYSQIATKELKKRKIII